MPDRPQPSTLSLYGHGMHDFVMREVEVCLRVANAEDDEACGMGPLLDAHFAEYMASLDGQEPTDA